MTAPRTETREKTYGMRIVLRGGCSFDLSSDYQEWIEKWGPIFRATAERTEAAEGMARALASVIGWAREQGIGIPVRCGIAASLRAWESAKGGGA